MSNSSQSASSSRSKLETVYTLLKQRIAQGHWQVGEQIPTEAELTGELKCSRSTIGMAISRLVHDGLVERKTRLGTRVLRLTPASDAGADGSAQAAERAPVQLDAYAFIYSSELHEGIFRMLQGFQLAARQRNRRVVTLTTGTDYRKEAEFINRLAEFDVKGAAMNPLLSSIQEQLFFTNALRTTSVPVVLVGPRLPGSGCPGVLLDNFHAGYTMTRHLIERGQSKIGFFANHAISHYVNDRYQGYRWAMKEAGLPEPVNSVFLEESRHIDFEDPLAEPTAFAQRYLDRVNLADVQAVVCVDDYFANGLIRAALSRGLRVPEDIKVTGVGGLSFQPPEGITLTTYQVPYERIGTETFHLIETTLAAQAAGSERPKDIVIEGQVLARSSTS